MKSIMYLVLIVGLILESRVGFSQVVATDVQCVGACIQTSEIASNAVSAPKIRNDSVNSSKILDGSLVDADISSSAAISASKISDGAGSGLDADLLDGLDSSQFLQSGGVTTGRVPYWNGSSLVNSSFYFDGIEGQIWRPDGGGVVAAFANDRITFNHHLYQFRDAPGSNVWMTLENGDLDVTGSIQVSGKDAASGGLNIFTGRLGESALQRFQVDPSDGHVKLYDLGIYPTSGGYFTDSPTAVIDNDGNASLAGSMTLGTLCLGGVCKASWPAGYANIYENGGNVGIGATNPSQKLSVAGGGIKLDNNQSLIWRDAGNASDTGVILYDNSNKLHFRPGATEQMTITPTGYVGVGTTSPWGKLAVQTNSESLTEKFVIGPSSTSKGNLVLESLPGAQEGFTTINWNGYYDGGDQRFDASKSRWRAGVDQREGRDKFFIDSTSAGEVFSASSNGDICIGRCD